jgi:hypothetical protein
MLLALVLVLMLMLLAVFCCARSLAVTCRRTNWFRRVV